MSTDPEATMKYLIMIQSNPHFAERFEALTDEQRAHFGRDHLALTRELAASGELVASEGLADPALAKRVTVRDGQTLTTDGPFAEVKEHLAGFYLVDVDGDERAIEIAARIPDAVWGLVEVRPVLDMSGWDI
ncbi:MAG TPA: YciI family protein [Jatrophihabitans sp.]|nr:YciI family protein [Jatrophihabitans sp.]